jgi:uncharacterized membrane protein HdeD (DUF308 family)
MQPGRGRTSYQVRGGDGCDSRAQSTRIIAILIRNWWVIALRGVCAILFGIIALVPPGVTIPVLTICVAAYMVIDGMVIIAGYQDVLDHDRWSPLPFEGVIDLTAGMAVMTWPVTTTAALVWITGGWAILSGLFLWIAVLRLNAMPCRRLLTAGGAVSMIWGSLLLVAPVSGAIVMAYWLAAYATVFGFVLFMSALKLWSLHQGLVFARAQRW